MESTSRGKKQFQYEALEERRLLAALEPVSAELIVEQQEVFRSAVPGEVVVALEDAGGIDDLYAYLSSLDFPSEAGIQVNSSQRLLTSNRESNQVTIVKLELDPSEEVEAIASRLAQLDEVVWASPNYQYTGAILDLIPNDPDFFLQSHHQLVRNTVAWDTTLGDSSVIIAVTDDGVDLTHPDLAANIWVNDDPIDGIDNDGNGFIDDINGWDFVANDNDLNPNFSFDSHGTHVAGIAAAVTNNGTGVAGTAGGATILPIRIAGSDGGFTSTILAQAFAYAIDNGAFIANTSYNIDGFTNDPIFTAGLQYYYDNGGLHFNSAGNNSQLDPARQSFHQTLLVANTDQSDFRSSSSNYGTGVDISAPGTSIYSTLPNGSYGFQSGTSMSAPNAAGAAALIWSANPTWNRDQVAAQLLATADSIDSVNPAFAGLLGSGRINTSNLSGTLPPPRVNEIVGLPSDGQIIGVDEAPVQFSISFDQLLAPASANNSNNYSLVNAGANKIFGDSDDFSVPITLETDYMVGTNDLNFSLNSGFGNGLYAFSTSVVNPFGTALDGNADGIGGDAFTTSFEIAAPPLLRVDPLGSIVFETESSGSITNGGVSQFTLELDADQLLSVVANPSADLDLQITIDTPSGSSFTDTGSGAGLDLVTNPISDSVAGTYVISVAGVGGTIGDFDIQLLVNSTVELESHDGSSNNTLATAQPIDGSSLDLGFGSADRLSVFGSLPSTQGVEVAGDDFESGVLGAQWTTNSSDPAGRIQVTGEFGTDDGSFALLMDNTLSGDVLNEAIWTVDLSGLSNPTLEFAYAEWGDENDSLPDSFVGSANGDGVAISDDGINWFTILNSPSTASGVWTQATFNLADAAAQAGFVLGANFQIKFQQIDNLSLTTDGRGYDSIRILTPEAAEDWYSFNLPDGEPSTISLTGQGPGVANLELYDANGNLVATGSGTSSTEQRIAQFVATGGTYFARVTGAETDYNLLVARGSDFNEEPGTDVHVQALPDVPSNVVFGFVGSGVDAQVEPDDFASGTLLDTVNDFVTLSTIDGGSVFAASASFTAPTGTIVFGPSATSAFGFGDSEALRADFMAPVSTVSIDAGSDDNSDVTQLQAFAFDGTLLETVTSSALASGTFETLTISRSSADIAYILASGVGGDVSPLDNLVVDGGADEDLYSVATVAGGFLFIDTLTPADAPFEPRNLLDVGVEIVDPNGNVVASGVQVGNESFSYEATTDGVHTIRVFAQQDVGEYVVRIQNQVGFLVSGATPSNGDVITEIPSSILLSFNEPFLVSSLQPRDFLLNGTPASVLTVLDSQTIELEFVNIPQGTNTLAVAEGAVLSSESEPINGFSSTFELDSIAPRIVNSSVQQNDQVSGTSFTFDFTFSEPMAAGIGANDFTLVGTNSRPFTAASFELINGVSDAVFSVTYDDLPEDNYTLTLFSGGGAFEDLVGNDLDGEPVFPLAPNVSGNGVAGGDFAVDFEVEFTSIPLSTPVTQLLPAGSVTYQQHAFGNFGIPSDVDRYELSVDGGQSITVRLDTDAASSATVELHDLNGVVATAATTTASDAIIQSYFVPADGDYEIHVIGSSVGDYSVQVLLNGDLEGETYGLGDNDTATNAQLISLIAPTSTHLRSVVGSLGDSGDAEDWYRFELAASDTATISVTGQSSSEFLVDLFDGSGTVLLARGVAAENLDSVINNVVNQSGGNNQYLARVNGNAIGDYQLVLSVNSDFDIEGNNEAGNAQPLGPTVAAHGFVGQQFDVDWYEFEATVGDTLTIETTTKSAGPFLINNSLDPELELYSPSGLLLASGNNVGDESFVHLAFESGVYQLRVAASTIGPTNFSEGEYLVSVTGATSASGSQSPRVVGSDLVAGSLLDDFPTSITLDFSESILATTIEASDLIIGGVPALSLTQLDGDTFVFEVDPASNIGSGNYQVSLAAGAVTDLQGALVDPYFVTFTFNNLSPANSFEYLGPLGGLTSASLLNDGVLNTASDTDVYFFAAEAGQLISASVQDTQGAGGNVGVQIAGLTSVASGTGQATLSPVVIPSDGIYGVIVSASQATNYSLSIFNGFISEGVAAGNDSSQANPLAIDVSQLVLGDGARYAVQGVSDATDFPNSGDVITNGSFETGDFTGWNTTAIGNPIGDWQISSGGDGGFFGFDPTQPQDGNFVAWNDFDGLGEYTLTQDVVVPANAELSFQYRAQWIDFAGSGRGFSVALLDPVTDVALATPFVFSTEFQASGNTEWITETIDLAAFAGQFVSLQFREFIPDVTGPGQIEFDAISLSSRVATLPDIDQYTIDLSGYVGQPVDIILDGINREDFSGQSLQLIGPDGSTVVATGLAGAATNYQLSITDFVVPDSGGYHLRFTSLVSGEYGLVVTPSIVFEGEPNNLTFLADRSLNSAGSGLGFLAVGDSDIFSIDLQAGESIAVSTQTPFDGGASSLRNLLDPAITIIASNGATTLASDLNSAADGKNAIVSFTAPSTGTYYVRISGSGTGDYFVTTESLNPIQVTDVVVASSDWTSSFNDVIAASTSGLGLGLTGPDQLRSLPWLNGIDTFHIQFSADVSANFNKNNLSLIGSSSDYLASASLTFDTATNIGTITLPTAVTQDALVLSVFDTIATSGSFFDGEWTDAVSTTSGEGTVGGHFHFQTNVLAGDVNGDGVVNFTGDLLPTTEQNTLIPTTLEETYFDVTADGVVNMTGDVTGIFDRNTHLLPASPSLPNPPVIFESASESLAVQATDEFIFEDAYAIFVQNYVEFLVGVESLTEDVSGEAGQNSNLIAAPLSLTDAAVTPVSASELPVDQTTAEFTQEGAVATFEQNYVDVSVGVPSLTEDVSSVPDQGSDLLAALPSPSDAAVIPESASGSAVDQFTATFVQGDVSTTLAQSDFYVSAGVELIPTEGVTDAIVQNTDLLSTSLSLPNPLFAPRSTSRLQIDRFMVDFAKEDEKDKRGEVVRKQNTHLLLTPNESSNQSTGAELASAPLVDQFMAYFAQGDEEDEVFGDYDPETPVLDSYYAKNKARAF